MTKISNSRELGVQHCAHVAKHFSILVRNYPLEYDLHHAALARRARMYSWWATEPDKTEQSDEA